MKNSQPKLRKARARTLTRTPTRKLEANLRRSVREFVTAFDRFEKRTNTPAAVAALLIEFPQIADNIKTVLPVLSLASSLEPPPFSPPEVLRGPTGGEGEAPKGS